LERFLTLKQVMEVTAQAKPTIYRGMRAGLFPRQIRLEAKPGALRAIAVWRESEIAEWQRQQIAKRDGREVA
jgi:predicted DNA-binding transcriptional regulator AlpA